MKTRTDCCSFLVTFILLYAFAAHQPPAFAQGTTFTYQGRLNDGANAASGLYDFRFILYDADPGGSQVGPILTNAAVAVSGGLFTASLDFGHEAFTGNARWLEIGVRTNGGGAFNTLTPRQALTAAPYAIGASALSGSLPASQLSGVVGSTNLSGTYSQALTFNHAANSFAGNGAGLTSLNASQLTTGTVPNARLSSQVAMRNAANTFTIGPQTLETFSGASPALVVRGATVQSANLQEWQDSGGAVVASVTGGGGFTGKGTGLLALNANNVDRGTLADARLSTNVALLDDNQTFTGRPAFSGGVSGTSPPFSVDSTNKVTNLNADLLDGVTSGYFWKITGNSGTAAGTHFLGTTDDEPLEIKVNGLRALRLAGSKSAAEGAPNLIGGSPLNYIASGVAGAVIAGGGATDYDGRSYSNAVMSDFSVIGGGRYNRIDRDALESVISGGYVNSIGNGSVRSAIAGGFDNLIGTNASYGTIAGGSGHTIGTNQQCATIGGGILNRIGTVRSVSHAIYEEDSNVIPGGKSNDIYPGTSVSVIGGGANNDVLADNRGSTLCGGERNQIGSNCTYSTIGGGHWNKVSTNASYATIPGGRDNEATNYAFAAGHHAKAEHTGAFVWADSTAAYFSSTDNDQVSFRCAGGVRFTSGSAGANQTVYWTPGSASWSFTSDRATKERCTPVDSQQVLAKVASLPITEWNYLGYPQRHIGPMAQDFHERFPLNDSDTTLNDADLHGVALAAIQGLNQKVDAGSRKSEVRSQRAEAGIQELRAENTELRQEVAELTALVKSLAAKVNGEGQ